MGVQIGPSLLHNLDLANKIVVDCEKLMAELKGICDLRVWWSDPDKATDPDD